MLFENLGQHPLANEGTLFMLLVWEEIFDPVTPDSYQPRLSNSLSLVNDIAIVIKELELHPQNKQQFEILKEELKKVIHEEEDLKVDSAYYKWLIEYIFNHNNHGKLVNILPALKNISGLLLKQIEDDVLVAAQNLPQKKEKAVQALKRLATLAIQLGHSAEDMRSLANISYLQYTPSDFAKHLLKAVHIEETEFRCVLAVRGSESDAASICRKVDFLALSKTHKIPQQIIDEVNKWDAKAKFYVSTWSKRIGPPRILVQATIKNLRSAVDIFNFYSEANALEVFNIAVIEFKSPNNQIVVDSESSGLRKRLQRSNSRELAKISLDKIPDGQMDGRMYNALEHYALAHSNRASRVKFINLWTALECIGRQGSNDSTISQICGVVPQIIVWRRSDKLLSYAATCLQKYRANKRVRTFLAGYCAANFILFLKNNYY